MFDKDKLIKKLLEINVIQYGDFLLKSGQRSSVYFDLRKLYGYPDVMIDIVDSIYKQHFNLSQLASLDQVCGVPSAGIPYAAVFSTRFGVPMMLLRKEKKEHGLGKKIEGVFSHDKNKVLLIEDVTTTGGSIIEACNSLVEEGMEVKHIVVIIDRRPSSMREMEVCGSVKIQGLLNLEDIMNYKKDE